MPTSTSATLRQARRLLMDRGELPAAGLVEPVVARSWRRCLDAGLVPASPLPDAPQLDARAVLRAIERQRELVAHARPVMEYLHGQTCTGQHGDPCRRSRHGAACAGRCRFCRSCRARPWRQARPGMSSIVARM